MAIQIRNLLSELRRRKVYRVAAVYIVVGLGILGAAEVILDPLGLTGVRAYVVIFVLLGFPIALVLAWAYEVRPEGPVSESERSEADGKLAEAVDAGAIPIPASPSMDLQSIAVLPFDSMSSDPEGDYFADGITEELTNALAKQKGLRVAARTSAFAFKNQPVDIREIGKTLEVSHVIEGSVRRTDEALRITAQLINTTDGYHVWSEQFDRSHGDVFRIQEEIAGSVVQKLLGELPEDRRPVIATADLSAYDSYLKGRHAIAQFHPATLQEGVEHFETAIEMDSRFAPALAGLAEALTMQSIGFSTRPGLEVMPRAEKAASRALELDPSLPEAHLARALAYMYGQWDYPAAKEEMDRALALNPNSAEAHFWAEFYWTYIRHDFENAIAANRRAVELSPLDSRIRGRFATVNYLFGELKTAEEVLREELAENPNHPLPHVSMADTLVRMGRFDEAIPHSEEAARLGGRAHAFLGMLAGFYGLAGNQAAAASLLEELEDRQRASYTPGFWMAVAYGGAGRIDDAFAALERAVVEKDSNLLYLFFSPRAAGMHDDPRFDDILRRIGLEHLLQYK